MNPRTDLISKANRIFNLASYMRFLLFKLDTELPREEQIAILAVISECGFSINKEMWSFDDTMNQLVPNFGFKNMFELGQEMEALL